MIEEEREKLIEQQTKVENLHKEIVQLLKDLTMDQSKATDLKANAYNKTLLEQEAIFEHTADDLRKRKAVRMEKYNKVNVQVVELSAELDEEPFTIIFEGIPSDAQVFTNCWCVCFFKSSKTLLLSHYLCLCVGWTVGAETTTLAKRKSQTPEFVEEIEKEHQLLV